MGIYFCKFINVFATETILVIVWGIKNASIRVRVNSLQFPTTDSYIA